MRILSLVRCIYSIYKLFVFHFMSFIYFPNQNELILILVMKVAFFANKFVQRIEGNVSQT